MTISIILLEAYLIITVGAMIFDLSCGRFMGKRFPIDELGPWFLAFIILAGFAWLPIFVCIKIWKLLCSIGRAIDAIDRVEVAGTSNSKLN